MAEPKATKTKPTDTAEAGQYTLAQVAELFELPTEAILAFKDYGAHIIAVTVDGRKLQAYKHD